MAVSMLAEATATRIHQNENPEGLGQSADVAKRGGKVAKGAKEMIEKEIGEPVVSPLNARQIIAGSSAPQIDATKYLDAEDAPDGE